MKVLKQKKAIAVLATLVAAIAVIGAYAYWTTSGTGSGSATTGTTVGITVKQTSVNTALYPGATTGLSGNFDNANASPVYVASVSASVTAFSVQADLSKPACTQADFTITGTALVGAEVAVASGTGSWSGLSLNMTNAVTNQDNCKSITVPITYTSN